MDISLESVYLCRKGSMGGMPELLRRQPPDLVSQVCSSASLSASYLCPELFSGETGQRGAQGPGMSILGTFKDDHSVTLPTVGSGPALPSSYRPRKAQSENLSDSVRGSSTSTSVAEGRRCLFVVSVLQLEAEPHSHRCSSWGEAQLLDPMPTMGASGSVPNTALTTKASF